MSQQRGFTLIELIVVLVLLGIVGAAATARFQDLSTEAATVAVRGVAAELSSAAAINYAASVVPGGTADVTLSADAQCDTNVVGQTDVRDLFQSGDIPTGYEVVPGPGNAISCATNGAGSSESCTLRHVSTAQTAVATIICTG